VEFGIIKTGTIPDILKAVNDFEKLKEINL